MFDIYRLWRCKEVIPVTGDNTGGTPPWLKVGSLDVLDGSRYRKVVNAPGRLVPGPPFQDAI
jgi:hypothetical protein